MKQILSLLLALALCAGLSVPALAAGFTDVPPGHYAVGAIDGCVAKGIVSGYADGSFKPDNPVTNAQFCVMAARAFYPELTAQNQGEVSKGWYMPYVRALWLTNAIEETAFSSYADFPSRADRFITRYDMAQMAKQILYRHRTKATDEQMAAAQANIGDWGAIPENYRKAVSTCYALGILGGQKDGTFGGDRYMNRAQGCVVIGRLDQLLGGAKPFMSSDQAASEAAVRPAAPPIQQSSAPQPSTFQTPVHPAADPAQFPEIRCLTCGYLMRQAGSPEMDYNNGGANGAMFHSCELCNAAYICNQCSKNMEDAAFNMRRHEAVCASGGDMIPIADFCSPYYRDSVYHQRLKSVTLTGDYRRDILAVAASQIGYMEGDNETQLDGSYGGRGGSLGIQLVFERGQQRRVVLGVCQLVCPAGGNSLQHPPYQLRRLPGHVWRNGIRLERHGLCRRRLYAPARRPDARLPLQPRRLHCRRHGPYYHHGERVLEWRYGNGDGDRGQCRQHGPAV